MDNLTLPGVLPTASITLEVLLGPRPDLDSIYVTVRDPAGRLVAQRSFPVGEKDSPGARLDLAWRAVLTAIPHECFAQQKSTRNRWPGPAEELIRDK